MTAIPSIKQAVLTAHRVFGSAANTQLAGILILSLLGMIASVYVLSPGDQKGGRRDAFYDWLN